MVRAVESVEEVISGAGPDGLAQAPFAGIGGSTTARRKRRRVSGAVLIIEALGVIVFPSQEA